MRRRPAAAFLAGALAILSLTARAQAPLPPAPTAWVTDTANFMSPAAASQLNDRLRLYEAQTKHQLLVWIGTTTNGVAIEDFAVRAFESWKVGRKGIDDGIVLFIMAADRKLRFEVGYGLEGDVPDIVAGRIINDIMVPRIRAGDNDGAVIAGMEGIAGAIGAGPLPGSQNIRPQAPPARKPLSLGQLIFFGIIGIILLIVFIQNPWLAILLMSNQSGRHRHGGWGGGGWGGGGGGGWSGGGGRSGGGGASGSW